MSLRKLVNMLRSAPGVTSYAIIDCSSGRILSQEVKKGFDSEVLSRFISIVKELVALTNFFGMNDFTARVSLEVRMVHLIKAGNLFAIAVRKKFT